MAVKIYTDKDADLKLFKGKTCAVLGFGSQGHAHALNLKESGVKVIIGLYPESKSRKVAKEKGFEVFDTAEAVRRADVIFVALPDTKQAAAYKKDIAPNLTKGKTLLFSHGFSIHYKTVVPPKDVDVILVALPGAKRAELARQNAEIRIIHVHVTDVGGHIPVKTLPHQIGDHADRVEVRVPEKNQSLVFADPATRSHLLIDRTKFGGDQARRKRWMGTLGLRVRIAACRNWHV